MEVALAGCGTMGLPMARALLAADFSVTGFDVRPLNEFGDFAEHMTMDIGLLSKADVLICVVRDQQQILDLCFEKQAVYQQIEFPNTFVVSSTVSPRFIQTLKQRLPDNVELIDAPMSGAPYSAIDKTLTFMLGGNAEAIARCMPLFNVMGKRIFRVGESGMGMAAKVFNNYLAATSTLAARKTLSRATHWGLAPEQLLEIMRESSGATWYGDNLEHISWAKENYSSDNTIGIIKKDVEASLDAASLHGEIDEFDKALIAGLQNIPAYPDSGDSDDNGNS